LFGCTAEKGCYTRLDKAISNRILCDGPTQTTDLSSKYMYDHSATRLHIGACANISIDSMGTKIF